MHHVVLEGWSRRTSLLHAREPRVKILALLAFLVALATLPVGLRLAWAGFAALLVAGALLARLPLPALVARSLVILPFTLAFAAASWLSGDGPRAVALVAKSYLSAFAVLLVMATTPLPRLLGGAERLGAPRVLVTVIQFLYRYLFVISEQAQHMLLASRCRAPIRRRTERSRFQAASGALAVLFARSFSRATGIQNAMAARGFCGHFPAFSVERIRATDLLFLVVSAGAAALLRFGVQR